TSARYRVEMAECYSTLGSILLNRGQVGPGGAVTRNATSLMERVVAASPSEPGYRALLAGTYRSMAVQPALALEEAEELLREAIRLCRELVTDFPNETRFQMELAVGHLDLGIVLTAAKRYKEAESSYREALRLSEPAAAASQFPSHRSTVACVLRGLAHVM